MFLVNSIKNETGYSVLNISVEIGKIDNFLIATPFSLIEKYDKKFLTLATLDNQFFGAIIGLKRHIEPLMPSIRIDFSNSYLISDLEISLTRTGKLTIDKNLFCENNESSNIPFFLSNVPGKYTTKKYNNSQIIGNILKNNEDGILIDFNQ